MKYYVQAVSGAYGITGPPESEWETSLVTESARAACIRYRELWRFYHPGQNCWSGHVRILGTDGLLYEYNGGREPGEPFLRVFGLIEEVYKEFGGFEKS